MNAGAAPRPDPGVNTGKPVCSLTCFAYVAEASAHSATIHRPRIRRAFALSWPDDDIRYPEREGDARRRPSVVSVSVCRARVMS